MPDAPSGLQRQMGLGKIARQANRSKSLLQAYHDNVRYQTLKTPAGQEFIFSLRLHAAGRSFHCLHLMPAFHRLPRTCKSGEVVAKSI
jgi:hypothetical protein